MAVVPKRNCARLSIPSRSVYLPCLGSEIGPTLLIQGWSLFPLSQRAMLQDVEDRIKLFPSLMGEGCPFFYPENCSYRMHKSKASTMRIVMFTGHGIVNAYTLETSLAGAKGRHFTSQDLLDIGEHFCRALFTYGDTLGPSAMLPSPALIPSESVGFQDDFYGSRGGKTALICQIILM